MRFVNCASGKQNFPGLAHSVGTLIGAAAGGAGAGSAFTADAGDVSLAAAGAGDSTDLVARAPPQAASKTKENHERRIMRRFLSRFVGHSTVTVLARFLG
jgi:hypothetical protein